MRIKYEKLTTVKGELTKVEATKATATHKHICYHDEDKPRPCKLEKI